MARTFKNWLLSGINKIDDFMSDFKFDGKGSKFRKNRTHRKYELNEDGDYLLTNENERNEDTSYIANSSIKDLTEIPESGIIQETPNEDTNINGNTNPTEESKQQISPSTNYEKIEELINKGYEREDAIRKETQAREDSAYQRAVEDMRKAGINPNLVGITPASSGGGISQASGTNLASTYLSNLGSIDTTMLSNATNKQIALFQAQLQDELKRLELEQQKALGEKKMAIDATIGTIQGLLSIFRFA